MGTKKHTGRTGAHPNHAVAALAGRQHGVVSRRQLRALGLSDEAITARARSGSLHPLFPGTFAVGHLRVDRPGSLLAAVLASGDGAVLSHGSAAELIGLWDRRPTVVDVIAPSQGGRKIDSVRWHNVPRPRPDEIEIRQGIPCTTPSRTLVDMAGRLGIDSLRRIVAQTAVLRLLDIHEVDRLLGSRRRRGAPLLRKALHPWRGEGGRSPRFRSLLEGRFLDPLVEAGLPRPRWNTIVTVGDKSFEADLLWEEERLIVETDGEKTHGTPVAFQEDRKRDQELLAAGYRTARVTWAQLEYEADAVVTRVREMLETGPA